jgi:hypothetical protein
MRSTLPFRIFIIIIFSLSTVSIYADDQLFSLTIVAPYQSLKSGAELRLRITVKNISGRPIAFIRSPGSVPEEGFRYAIEVRDDQGRLAPISEYVRELKKKATGTFESRYARWLKPGESFEDEVTTTKFYDLTRPGKYAISVSREILPAQELPKGKVTSNSVIVTVIQ